MTTVTIHQAKTHLSRLLKLVEQGEEVIIKKFDTPIAKLSVIAPPPAPRKPGRMKGKIHYNEADLKAADEEIAKLFLGEDAN